MPAQQRGRGDDPVIEQVTREQPAQCGQHDAVGGLEMGPVDLPAENVDFLAQYEQLDVLAGRTTPSQDDQRQQAPEHGVDNRQQHQP